MKTLEIQIQILSQIHEDIRHNYGFLSNDVARRVEYFIYISQKGLEVWDFLLEKRNSDLVSNDVVAECLALSYLTAREILGTNNDVSVVLFDALNILCAARSFSAATMKDILTAKNLRRPISRQCKDQFFDMHFARDHPILISFFQTHNKFCNRRVMLLSFIAAVLASLNMYVYLKRPFGN